MRGAALFVTIMLLRLDWEEEARSAVAAQVTANATEEGDDTEDAGADLFSSEPLASPHSHPRTPQHQCKAFSRLPVCTAMLHAQYPS